MAEMALDTESELSVLARRSCSHQRRSRMPALVFHQSTGLTEACRHQRPSGEVVAHFRSPRRRRRAVRPGGLLRAQCLLSSGSSCFARIPRWSSESYWRAKRDSSHTSSAGGSGMSPMSSDQTSLSKYGFVVGSKRPQSQIVPVRSKESRSNPSIVGSRQPNS